MLESKLAEIEAEDVDVIVEEEPDTTSTEDERDESQRLAVLLQQQLLQLQEASARADATIVEQNAALQQIQATPPTTTTSPSPDDLWLEFVADPKLLPAATGTSAELAADTTLNNLGTLFAAVPWAPPFRRSSSKRWGRHRATSTLW